MHLLFIWPAINNSVATQLGLGYISSLAKTEGHRVSLLRIDKRISPGRLARYVRSLHPDLVGFSIVSNQWHYAKAYALAMKTALDIPLLAGGIHVTLNPEMIAQEGTFDFLCLGEGEYAIRDLLSCLSRGDDPGKIPNIWVRGKGGWTMNPVRPLIQDLDSLPFPDVALFFPDPSRIENMEIMAGRGCPYSCTYCCTPAFRKIYAGTSKKFIRYRTQDNVLSEIDLNVHIKGFPVRRVVFHDDTFTLNKQWLLRFCTSYKKKFTIPFTCNARVETLDEEALVALKEAGCDCLEIGVESGNEQLRTRVLGRKMSDRKIIQLFDLAKKIGIGTYAFYILGFPGETSSMLEDTYRLHRRLNPDKGFQIATFYPYHSTQLWEVCAEQGLIKDYDRQDTFTTGTSILRLPIKKDVSKMYKKFYRLSKSFTIRDDNVLRTSHPWAFPLYKVARLFIGSERVFPLFRWARKKIKPAVFINARQESHIC